MWNNGFLALLTRFGPLVYLLLRSSNLFYFETLLGLQRVTFREGFAIVKLRTMPLQVKAHSCRKQNVNKYTDTVIVKNACPQNGLKVGSLCWLGPLLRKCIFHALFVQGPLEQNPPKGALTVPWRFACICPNSKPSLS